MIYYFFAYIASRDLLCPHEKRFCVPTTNAPFNIIKIFFFTDNLRPRLYYMRTSQKTDFRKLKITLVGSTYPGRCPQCPSVSLSVSSCSLAYSAMQPRYNSYPPVTMRQWNRSRKTHLNVLTTLSILALTSCVPQRTLELGHGKAKPRMLAKIW